MILEHSRRGGCSQSNVSTDHIKTTSHQAPAKDLRCVRIGGGHTDLLLTAIWGIQIESYRTLSVGPQFVPYIISGPKQEMSRKRKPKGIKCLYNATISNHIAWEHLFDVQYTSTPRPESKLWWYRARKCRSPWYGRHTAMILPPAWPVNKVTE
jgi:hypothetical protein